MKIVQSKQRWFGILVGTAILAVAALMAGALFAASAPPQSQLAVPLEPSPGTGLYTDRRQSGRD